MTQRTGAARRIHKLEAENERLRNELRSAQERPVQPAGEAMHIPGFGWIPVLTHAQLIAIHDARQGRASA